MCFWSRVKHRLTDENYCELCKVNKLLFQPRPIYCTPCGVRIKRNAIYYILGTGEQRHAACMPCYNAAKETLQRESHMVPKGRLERKMNKEELEEGVTFLLLSSKDDNIRCHFIPLCCWGGICFGFLWFLFVLIWESK